MQIKQLCLAPIYGSLGSSLFQTVMKMIKMTVMSISFIEFHNYLRERGKKTIDVQRGPGTSVVGEKLVFLKSEGLLCSPSNQKHGKRCQSVLHKYTCSLSFI